jgi:hypothetical protein
MEDLRTAVESVVLQIQVFGMQPYGTIAFTLGSAIMQYLRTCETSRYAKSRNKNGVTSEDKDWSVIQLYVFTLVAEVA